MRAYTCRYIAESDEENDPEARYIWDCCQQSAADSDGCMITKHKAHVNQVKEKSKPANLQMSGTTQKRKAEEDLERPANKL